MKLKKLFEDLANMAQPQPQKVDDHEATMAIADLKQIADFASQLAQKIQAGDELEGWVQSKITKSADYMEAVYKYYHYNPDTTSGCTSCGDSINEAASTCCGKCGHKHVKGTSCPKPYLTGKRHCRNRK